MKRLITLVLSMAPFWMFAQQSTVLQSSEEEAVVGSKVLVIPFHQTRYYFSDCDKAIAAESKMKLPDVRRSFMFGLDYATESRFEKRYEPMNLAQMKDSVDSELLGKFYDNVTYAYETPSRLTQKVNKGVFGKLKAGFKQIGQKEKPKTLNEEESYTLVEAEEDKYMALNWANVEFLDALVGTYSPDYIVTVNQFEIKTDYRKCIDRELGNYTRRIKIHYNVFDPSGKRIYGDVVTARYNSTKDDINSIIQDNFGILSDFIMKSLPRT